MSTIDEELEALERENEEAEEAAKARDEEQDKVDRLAFLRLKKEHGGHVLAQLRLRVRAPGLPGTLVVRAFDRAGHRRYEELQTKAGKDLNKLRHAFQCAVHDSLLYPDQKTFEALVEHFRDLPGTVAQAAVQMSKGRAEEEGKD